MILSNCWLDSVLQCRVRRYGFLTLPLRRFASMSVKVATLLKVDALDPCEEVRGVPVEARDLPKEIRGLDNECDVLASRNNGLANRTQGVSQ